MLSSLVQYLDVPDFEFTYLFVWAYDISQDLSVLEFLKVLQAYKPW